jgi:hypothetical protein
MQKCTTVHCIVSASELRPENTMGAVVAKSIAVPAMCPQGPLCSEKFGVAV